MSISDKIKQVVLGAVKAAGFAVQLGDIEVEHPTMEERGDYSTNIALKLAKQTGQNPTALADKIIASLIRRRLTSVASVSQSNGFINFALSQVWQVEQAEQVLRGGDKYGSSEMGAGKTVVIDYSSPNIAKRFGIGHLRSTIIGQAIYNLFKFSGYKTIGDNHLGDWGTQFGSILAEIQNSKVKIQNLTIDQLEKMYVDFNQKAEADPKLKEQAREWFARLEKGDATARNLWNKCVEISMAEFNRIYDLLGVKIDYAYGESFYEGLMGEVITEAKSKGVTKQSEGAWVIEIPELKTPLLLVKSDGGTTYATRDLATLKFRQKEWNPDLVVYEVGAEQALHFIQVFAAARRLGYVKENAKLVHTKHGLYRWEHGKMKTRRGDTVKLEEILDEAIARAKKLGSADEATAKAVGIGAVKYFDLKHNVQSDIIFDWEKMFSLEGDSGPYLQYTFARARSVLRKANLKFKIHNLNSNFKFQISNLKAEELVVLRYLYRFPEVVELAARTYSPNLVCTYLFELAKRFNNFYNNVPIIEKLRSSATPAGLNLYNKEAFRLGLTTATAQVIKNGLTLLGIEALERM